MKELVTHRSGWPVTSLYDLMDSSYDVPETRAFRSRYFRSRGSLLLGSLKQNITFVGNNTCPTENIAKGSIYSL